MEGTACGACCRELVLTYCRRREKAAATAHIQNSKIQAKHTHTRPLANAFCFTGSSASPTPFPENGKADSSWGQGYTQWENKERKSVIITVGKGGTSFRALGN